MRISVFCIGHTLKFDPDPATVKLGESVDWSVQYVGEPDSKLFWKIYFDHGTPFPLGEKEFTLKTSDADEKEHRHDGTVAGGTPENEGEYKYGVGVEDQKTGFKIADDDPYLIVRR